MPSPASVAARNERSLSVLVPFTACHTQYDLLTKQNDIVRTFYIKGLPFETSSQMDIDGDVEALHSFVRSFCDERIGIYQHTIQRKCEVPDLMPSFNNDFAREVCTEYQKGLEDSDLFVVDLYLTIVYRCEESNDSGFLTTLASSLKKVTSSLEEIKHIRKKGLDTIVKISRAIESNLAAYGPRLLGDYKDEYGITISEPLTFENYLISGFHQTIQKPKGIPLWDYLGSGSYFAGLDLIELRRGNERRFAQLITVKGYAAASYAGVLDDLYRLDVEFTSCVSYCGLHRHTAANKLRDQQIYLENVGNTDDAEEVGHVRSGLVSGVHSVGEFTVTLRVIADTVQGVLDDTAKVMSAMQHRSLNPQTCGLGTDAAFFSQVPGNFEYRLRVPMYTSQNFVDFTPMHNDHEGKATGNPWGNALLTLKTKSNRIAYLNLHHVESHEDLKGTKPPGSAVIVGQTGSGKSTVLNLFNLSMMQFDNADSPLLSVTFGIKQDCKRTIESMGGVYSQLKNGQRTGYNPFKMDATPDNIIFLDQQVVYLCSQDGNKVTTADRADIERAVRTVMSQPKADRGFTLLLQSITVKDTDDSLHLRLAPWATNDGMGHVGTHAWALDNENDSLDFDANSVFGIDGTDLLANPTVRTPVLMYLLYRIKQVLGTRRVCLFMDELQKWITNEDITDWIADCLATIRSMDGIVVMATQMPESILKNPAGEAIVQQAATFLFLKNPQARPDIYKKLGMTDPEFKALMELQKYHFIFKQENTSVTATADISSLSNLNRSIIAGDSL